MFTMKMTSVMNPIAVGKSVYGIDRKEFGIYCRASYAGDLALTMGYDDAGRLTISAHQSNAAYVQSDVVVYRIEKDEVKKGNIVLVQDYKDVFVAEILAICAKDTLAVKDVIHGRVYRVQLRDVHTSIDLKAFNVERNEILAKQKAEGQYMENHYVQLNSLISDDAAKYIGSFAFNDEEEIVGVITGLVDSLAKTFRLAIIGNFDKAGKYAELAIRRGAVYVKPSPSPILSGNETIADYREGNVVMEVMPHKQNIVGRLTETGEVFSCGGMVNVRRPALCMTSDIQNLNRKYL